MSGKAGRRRQRRTWYKRRLRLERVLIGLAAGIAVAGACWQMAALHRSLFLPSMHASQGLSDSYWARGNVRKNLAFAAARSAKPAKSLAWTPDVYPYSVVPGGMKSPADLRAAAARDAVVRRHYARFDYDRARLVRLAEAREVYISYRIRDTVFWTRRKVRLRLGELLLTDGKITARAGCGNQISDEAKPEVSNEEPEEDVLERPVAALDPPLSPIRPVLAPFSLPSGQALPPPLFGGPFLFPYVPVNIPLPPRVCAAGDIIVDGHCRPKRHRPTTTPEPSTMVLAASGLALIGWRYRRTGRATAK
jgi:hypothetical protein